MKEKTKEIVIKSITITFIGTWIFSYLVVFYLLEIIKKSNSIIIDFTYQYIFFSVLGLAILGICSLLYYHILAPLGRYLCRKIIQAGTLPVMLEHNPNSKQ